MNLTYQIIWFLIATWLVPFCLHIAIQAATGVYTTSSPDKLEEANCRKPPYGLEVTLIAILLSLIPTATAFLIINLIYEEIPGSSPLTKGICFSILRLCLNGDLIRTPLMNIVVGNPFRNTILKQCDIWIPNLIMCIALSFLAASTRE
ncbi:hypothetical protein Lepto7375DRAFT_6984 [Leptolyngbya sp. PCC 7375]|nr:hypothetical protein Lepto7375DRAFT_6984 [Leptolyngbya sp. PCC 7375]